MSEFAAKMDDLGRPAWIALMVAGFILFWPVGLAVLAYLIWSGRMTCGRSEGWGGDPRARIERKIAHLQEKLERWGREGSRNAMRAAGLSPSGNRAFNSYREATLAKLEEEAREFREFLAQLRHAKDKAEFDQFMDQRRNRPAKPEPRDVTPPPAA